jgi:uncharacterized protein (DUF1778 family)
MKKRRHKTERLALRATPAQIRSWREAATLDRRSLSSWVCAALDDAAEMMGVEK